MIAAPIGLAITKQAWAGEVAKEIAKLQRPSVVWLEFQDCTGCTETLLRTSRPSVDELIFNVISLDYHETLMPGAGKQAEKALRDATEGKEGKYFVVCEGSIPTKDDGNYLKIAGRQGHRPSAGHRRQGSRRHRHGLLRFVGRDTFRG